MKMARAGRAWDVVSLQFIALISSSKLFDLTFAYLFLAFR